MSNRFWCRGCYKEWHGGEDIACECGVDIMHWLCVNFEDKTFFEFTESSILSTDGTIFSTLDKMTPGWMNVGCLPIK